MITLQKP